MDDVLWICFCVPCSFPILEAYGPCRTSRYYIKGCFRGILANVQACKATHHQTASAPGVLGENLRRLGREDNINYQDSVLYAQYVKIWIIMYHEQTKQWEFASPIFYNYMPTAIVFMRENSKLFHSLS